MAQASPQAQVHKHRIDEELSWRNSSSSVFAAPGDILHGGRGMRHSGGPAQRAALALRARGSLVERRAGTPPTHTLTLTLRLALALRPRARAATVGWDMDP